MNHSDEEDQVDWQKRKLLKAGACMLGGIGILAAMYPFLKSLEPTDQQLAEHGSVTVDISHLHENEQITVAWQAKPVWVMRRSQADLHALTAANPDLLDPNSLQNQQPHFAQNPYRSLRPEILVLVGLCTHLGCIPNYATLRHSGAQFASDNSAQQNFAGFLCPCHGSRYDLAGRVFKNMPAPLNLVVPPYHFLDEHTLVIGQ